MLKEIKNEFKGKYILNDATDRQCEMGSDRIRAQSGENEFGKTYAHTHTQITNELNMSNKQQKRLKQNLNE